jgi:hypothetical protein
VTPALALAALLVAAACHWIRLAGVDAPFVYHADEPLIVLRAMRMLALGELNPHWFRYPPLPIYFHAALELPVRLLAAVPVAGAAAVAEPCQGVPPEAFPYVHAGRLGSVAFALATVVQIVRVTNLLGHRWAGLGAGLLFAASPLAAQSAAAVTVDMPMAFFVITAVYFAVRAMQRTDAGDVRRDCTWFTVAAALAACVKYNAAVLLLLLPVVIAMKGLGARRILSWTVAHAVLAAGIFLVTTPFAVLDPEHFWDASVGMPYNIAHYARGHVGFDQGSALLKSAATIWRDLGPLSVLALCAVPRLFTRRGRTMVAPIFLSVVLLWIPVAAARVYFPRNVLGLAPMLACLALIGATVLGDGLARGLGRIGAQRWRQDRLLAAVLGVALVVQAALQVRGMVRIATLHDVRTEAYHWIGANLAPGTRVISEWYTPQVHFDPRYRVRCVRHLSRSDFDAMRASFDVALVSSAIKSRFGDPATTTYAKLGPERVIRRWASDAQRGTKGPEVELYRLD